jgi:hypothetical protein
MSRVGHVPFVVLFQGRTGSTYLMEALDAHPAIRAGYEDITSSRWEKKGGEAQVARARRLLLADADEWAARPFDPKHPARAVGFKVKLRDVVALEAFGAMLHDVRARVIHLQRRNVVKLTVSNFNSQRIHEATGDWNLYERGAISESFHIPFELFDSALERVEARRRDLIEYVAALELPSLTLFYEDIVEHHDETVALAFAFLGVEAATVQGAAVKATRDDLRTVLENFDDLRARYVGTRYASMFDESLVPQ